MLEPAALDLLWVHVEPRLYVERSRWEHVLKKFGWHARAVRDGQGVVTGAILTRGSEVHVAGHGITRARMQQTLGTLKEKFGCVTTRIPKEMAREQWFAVRLGFVKCSECEFDYHYRLEDDRYARPAHQALHDSQAIARASARSSDWGPVRRCSLR